MGNFEITFFFKMSTFWWYQLICQSIGICPYLYKSIYHNLFISIKHFPYLSSYLRRSFNKKCEFCLLIWQQEALFIATLFSRNFNCDGSFHVSEDCQHDLLWRLQCSELFPYRRVSVFPFNLMSFQLRDVLTKLWLAYLESLFFFQ